MLRGHFHKRQWRKIDTTYNIFFRDVGDCACLLIVANRQFAGFTRAGTLGKRMGPPRVPSTKDTEHSQGHKVSDPGLNWGISAVEVSFLVHLLYNNSIVCRMPRSRLAFGLQWSYIPFCTRNSNKVGSECNQLHALGPVSCYSQPKQDTVQQEKTG